MLSPLVIIPSMMVGAFLGSIIFADSSFRDENSLAAASYVAGAIIGAFLILTLPWILHACGIRKIVRFTATPRNLTRDWLLPLGLCGGARIPAKELEEFSLSEPLEMSGRSPDVAPLAKNLVRQFVEQEASSIEAKSDTQSITIKGMPYAELKYVHAKFHEILTRGT